MKRPKHNKKSSFANIIGVSIILMGGVAAYLAVNTTMLDGVFAQFGLANVSAQEAPSAAVPQPAGFVSPDDTITLVSTTSTTNETSDATTSETSDVATNETSDTTTSEVTGETMNIDVTTPEIPVVQMAADAAVETYMIASSAEAVEAAINNQLAANTDETTEAADGDAQAITLDVDAEMTTTTSDMMMVNTGARARTCPDTSCNVVFTLRHGLTVAVIDTTQGQAVYGDNDQWMEVEFEGQTGFIYSDLLNEIE